MLASELKHICYEASDHVARLRQIPYGSWRQGGERGVLRSTGPSQGRGIGSVLCNIKSGRRRNTMNIFNFLSRSEVRCECSPVNGSGFEESQSVE